MAQTSDFKPSFNIYRADGSMVPTLRKSFIIKEMITRADTGTMSFCMKDDTRWTLVMSEETEQEINYNDKAYCILSMQVHEIEGHSENYAVARLFKDKKYFDMPSDFTGAKHG